MEKNIFNNIPLEDSVFIDIFSIEKNASISDFLDGFITKNHGIDPEIDRYLNSKEFKPDKTKNGYLIMSAMGAEEGWGSNMNFDAFKEDELLKSHKTFENGYAYEQHVNKDPKKSCGKVLFSTYNKEMRRVELVVEVFDKNEKGKKFMDKLWQVSMGTNIAYDECPICGNKAKTKKDYCVHIKNQLGRIMPDGVKVVMINVGCKFFDISFVKIAADLTGRTLKKIASLSEKGESPKMADIDKEVQSNITPNSLKSLMKDVYSGKKIPKEMEDSAKAIKEGKLGKAIFFIEKNQVN